jgi:hypothetical protein
MLASASNGSNDQLLDAVKEAVSLISYDIIGLVLPIPFWMLVRLVIGRVVIQPSIYDFLYDDALPFAIAMIVYSSLARYLPYIRQNNRAKFIYVVVVIQLIAIVVLLIAGVVYYGVSIFIEEGGIPENEMLSQSAFRILMVIAGPILVFLSDLLRIKLVNSYYAR